MHWVNRVSKDVLETSVCPPMKNNCISCSKGGFPSLRHNEVRDLTATMMSEVCSNVSTEPHLQPLTGEALCFKTANSESNARLDIAANGFWGRWKV